RRTDPSRTDGAPLARVRWQRASCSHLAGDRIVTSGEPIVPPARDTGGEHALRRANARLDRWEALTAWMLSSPALLFMLVMLFSPVLAVLAISFTDWDFGAAGFSFVGKANYAELLNDPVFWKSLRNTIF